MFPPGLRKWLRRTALGSPEPEWACLFSDDDTHCMFGQMTTGMTDDPKHWRDRAQEVRIRAGELNDPGAKRQMLGIARGYDRLAERAEGRLRPTPPSEPSH